MESKISRNKLIVNPRHARILLIIISYILVTVVLSGFLMFLPSFITLHSAEVTDLQIAAAKEVLLLQKRFWPAILIAITILATHSLFMSHKIFGPLYRFRLVFKEIAKGNFAVNTNIRKNDILKEEEEELQKMVSSLNKGIVGIKSEITVLSVLINNFEHQIASGKSLENETLIEYRKIQHLVKNIENKIDYFNLADFKN